ncbi:MAG: hypothetical protein IKY18_03630 [Oscillospiraceae bacterium]|nr:hypothetical protein [Oscillospiraceae bacterium]
MTQILLCKYNNYYNRRKKAPAIVATYIGTHFANTGEYPYIEGSSTSNSDGEARDVNFWENDGVDTAHVFNCSKEQIDKADYAVVFDSATFEIDSRWFIMEAVKNTYGQYNATLHRDVIADNWDTVLDTDAMIQRGIIDDISNPILLQKEGNTYNKIKKRETMLPDRLNARWAVGYITRPTNPSAITVSVDPDITPREITEDEYNKLWVLANYPHILKTPEVYVGSGYSKMDSTQGPVSNVADVFFADARGPVSRSYSGDATSITWTQPATAPTASGLLDYLRPYYWKINFSDNYTAITDSFKEPYILPGQLVPSGTYNRLVSQEQYNDILTRNGEQISYNGNIYTIKVSLGPVQEIRATTQNVDLCNDYKEFVVYASSAGNFPLYTAGNFTQLVTMARGQAVVVELVPASAGATTITFDWNHKDLTDAPWAMFAIPLDPVAVYYEIEPSGAGGFPTDGESPTGTGWLDTDVETSRLAVRGIIEQMGAHVKDVQIIPWCPLQDAIEFSQSREYYIIDTERLRPSTALPNTTPEQGTRMIAINQGGKLKSICFFAKTSSGDAVLAGPDLDVVDGNTTSEEIKIASETHVARIVSQNHNGVFEFSPMANWGVRGGSWDRGNETAYHNSQWIGRWTYKPFAPYIQVTVNWSPDGMYGGDYKDARGLICQGDFSMPQANDAWTDYTIRNKNYQGIFDRQIENLQFTQRQERTSAILGIAKGAVGGGISAAAAGISKGGVTAGIIGGIAGTGLSVAGGVVDYNMMKARQREAQDYAGDMFRMNLENIQASPTSINKVGALDYAFRAFPVVEEYEASEQEVAALRTQIKKTGMRVGAPGKIRDYTRQGESRYVQANVIQFPDALNGDFHISTAIAEECARGMYIEY